ncbi:hypothetical protein LINPERHAP2_LOCUS12146 [Linum perenne]
MFWFRHGERLDENRELSIETDANDTVDEMHHLITDLFPNIGSTTEAIVGMEFDDVAHDEPNEDAKKFYRLLDESKIPAFRGCKSSKLSILVKLLHIKTLGSWSNESFTMLLKLLKEDILPADSSLPDSYHESKKLIRDLGLSYTKIDACQNSCMLFWKDNTQLDNCLVCKTSRWKIDKHSQDVVYKANGKRLPVKTLRYFPIKPRLQRLFMSSKNGFYDEMAS